MSVTQRNGRSPAAQADAAGLSALTAARWSFFIAGMLSATLSARMPAVQARLELSDADLAIALIGLNLGAVAGLQSGALVVRLLGSRNAGRVVLPTMALALSSLLLPTGLAMLTAGFFLFLGINALMDVILNMQGAYLERTLQRRVMASVHAFGSLGMVVAAGLCAVAERLEVGLELHLLALSVVSVVWSIPLGRRYISFEDAPTEQEPDDDQSGGRASGRWWPLGAIAFLLCLAEGSITDWVAVYLVSVGAPTSTAALGFGVFTGCITLGRLKADAVVARFGAGPTYAATTVTGSIVLIAGLLSHSHWLALCAIGVYGLGIASGFPLVMAAASRVTHLATSRAIARVGTVGYSGFFLGPVLVGAIQAWSGLGMALGVIAVMLAGSAFMARSLD